jgi:DNA-directed RNA polymerase sigma subunit (sigma70/sigma32)
MNFDRLTSTLLRMHDAASSKSADEVTARMGAEFARLPEIDQEVLAARFALDGGRPKTLTEVSACREDLTPNRVRLVEARALEALGGRVFSFGE